ncbi:MAG: InlB B-repeat-containing protein, partial [Bacilli bacterium]|nr:InlB B-repeat-containing protein [Bacilli bacterium]
MKKGFFRSFLALSLSGAMLAGCSVNSVMRSVNDAATDSNFNMQDIIPYIGDNGNWWIGGSDTGVSATGQAGKDGQDGKDGHDGQDGRDGHDGQDGQTPYIGPNGNWWIGDTDTGVSAEGAGGAEHAGEIFRVTFDANGGFNGMGQTVWDVEVEWGNTVPLPIPERAGFSFLGWFSGTGDSVRAFLETDAVFTNIHLTAQWAPRNYTIYLDANGGYFDGSSEISVTYWEAYHLPTYVTRNGYVFKGWYEGDNQWSYDGTYGSSNDVWLTAKWEVGVQYTITLDLNGGRFADGYDYLTDKIVVIPGNWYELPRSWQLFKENYEFQGWYDEGDNYFSESGSYNLSNGITLKAKWAETQYQIYLQPNGGELENGVSQYQYYYYHRTYELPIPHKEGYSFLGWYEGDNLWPNSGVYSRKESVTLTARWEVRTEFTLKLNLNKGTYEGASATEWTVALGDYYELPTEGLVRDGYVFAGWYYGEVRWADSGTYPVKDDRTLAAKWMEKENYRFYLDFQGGFYAGEPNASVAFNNDHAYYGDVPTLPIPSKDNATFDGYAYQYRWNKVVNNLGKVEDYPWAGGSTNSNGEVQVTLTARWKDGVSEGDTIYFGEYPQTVVEDQNLLANLESREADENNIVEFSGNRYKKAACDTDYWNGGIKSSS